MDIGTWNVNVNDKMPQAVASAMAALEETLLGSQYEFLAYLGSQVVNGTNHAVLAKQTVLTGRDSDNVVVLIFNEKPGDIKATLVNIERVLESGVPMGGVQIFPAKELTDEFKTVWSAAFEGFVSSNVEPVMQLGTRIVKGVNYIYLATVTPVIPDATSKIFIVTINPMEKDVSLADVLASRQNRSMGYAFTW